MAAPSKTSCLLLLATIFTNQVSALPFFSSVLPRGEPILLSSNAICNQSYYNDNNTLSLIIDKINHAITAHVFDNTCKSISDTINLSSNASGTTVTTSKGPLVIISIEIPASEDSANTARSAKSTLETSHDTKERRTAPCGDYNGEDACTGQVYGPTNGPTTDEAPQVYRRLTKDIVGSVIQERQTENAGGIHGSDPTTGQVLDLHAIGNGPSTDQYKPGQRRSAKDYGGITGTDPSTGQVLDPNAVGNGASTKDYTPPSRRDQETDNIVDTRIEFTFNRTSFGGILSKLEGGGCSDGGNDGSKDQCPAGQICCHLVF